MIIKPMSTFNSLMDIKKRGRPRKGLSTGYKTIDEHMLLNKKYLMLITGFPGSGKTEWLNALSVNTAIQHNWKWLFFSPEVDDISSHVKNLVQLKAGKRLVSMTNDEIKKETEWADEHYAWIDTRNSLLSLDDIMEETRNRIQSGHEVDVLVIDPWNECDHSKQSNRDDVYISQCLTELRNFHRKYNILTIIVIHPHSVTKDKNGNFPIAALRDCAGGAMWWNKADYGICVHRPDPTKHGANIIMQKVKQKDIGYAGSVFLDYDVASGRFKDIDSPSYTLPEQVEENPFASKPD